MEHNYKTRNKTIWQRMCQIIFKERGRNLIHKSCFAVLREIDGSVGKEKRRRHLLYRSFRLS